jgi:polar amino acid transport system substrate-binding protein
MRNWKSASLVIALLTIVSLVLAACGPAATPVPPTQPPAPPTKVPEPTKPPEPTKAPEPTKPPAPTATPAPKTLLDIIKARGVLKVSTDPNYKPQSFINEKGELDGFDIDVAKEVAKRLGVKVEFVTPDWDIIVAGNWGGRWDLSIGSMTITPDRKKVLFFSSPYYYTPAQFAVHKNSTLTKIEDFGGKTVCVGSGTTYESYLGGTLTLEGEPILKQVTGAKAQVLTTDSECIQAIQAGRKEIAGVLTAQPTIEDAITNGAPIKKLGDPVYYEDLAAAMDKNVPNSEAFVEAVTKAIDEMRKDGTLTKLSVKWYGVDISTKKQ